jgi:pyridoxine 5-phosphate synthase
MNTLSLGVNIDHVASLRQARGTRYPEPLAAALLAEQAGADSITVHLREDRRHIQERDVNLLSEVLQTRMNLEMAATDAMVEFAERCKPADCCLVPERRAELTTEGGLNVADHLDRMRNVCDRLATAGIRVSLFIEPDPRQIEAAAHIGVPVIELHTGTYADAPAGATQAREFTRLEVAAEQAHALGLRVHAGHGLNYHNVTRIAAVPLIQELNIGHSIIARALFRGLAEAVKEMKYLMLTARGNNAGATR